MYFEKNINIAIINSEKLENIPQMSSYMIFDKLNRQTNLINIV